MTTASKVATRTVLVKRKREERPSGRLIGEALGTTDKKRWLETSTWQGRGIELGELSLTNLSLTSVGANLHVTVFLDLLYY